jgi:hypothetical protein
MSDVSTTGSFSIEFSHENENNSRRLRSTNDDLFNVRWAEFDTDFGDSKYSDSMKVGL